MRIRYLFLLMICALITTEATASPRGKIDAGPIYLEADVLSAGVKVEHLEMWGASATGTLLFFHDLCLPTKLLDGICFKPRFLVAGGDGDLWNVGIGVGYYLPITDCFTLIPNGGITWGELDSTVNNPPFPATKLDEKFESTSPYLGVDASFTHNCWMVTGMFQYSWSRSKTTVTDSVLGLLRKTTTESTGVNYAVQVDYYFTECWSVNATFAHNESQSKERDGLEITGGRVGLGYTF